MTQEEDNKTDIWSTRVQRELLALETEDAEASEHTKAMLPPFVNVKSHKLSLVNLDCTVSFEVDVRKGDQEIVVVFQLDTSFPKHANGELKANASVYPFAEPIATLISGQEHFPDGSTIKNGNRISIDIEWTPSLHMADAIMNVSLKVKESILQEEPFHPAPRPAHDPIEDVAEGARRLASRFTKGATSIGKALTPPSRKKQQQPPPERHAEPKSPATNPQDVRIGDDINLLEEPWVDARGVYACKAIRRPEFIEDAMAVVEQESFSSPTAMFRSFTKSARNVLQESFLMITDSHIIEMKSSKLNPTVATVTFCISIDLMHKLKFRRQESLSLFFKPAPEDPLVYMCPDSGDAVHQIQAVLKSYGVKGKHTNAAANRAIGEAMSLVQEIQTKELALKHDPSVNRVNEIMDLYRQAAERFEAAGDIRHEEVVVHMRKFLALPLTASILDGSYQKAEETIKPKVSKGQVPLGEVIERTECQLEEDDHDDVPPSTEKEKDRAFEENMDNLLREAEADLERFKSDTEDSIDIDEEGLLSEDSSLADMAADLDDMMKKADAELAELLKS